MSNWGISPNASEKEKIKADYADILHGMNSTGAIPYDVYSDLFDDGMELLDRMYEQGKADHLINNNVTVQEEGYWINIPPYRAINGDYSKAQECPKCHAFFVSNGNEPYSNHPYCCECGARLYPQPPKGE